MANIKHASIIAITPTGARQEALEQLGKCIRSQSFTGRVRWVVIDDCDPPMIIPEVPQNWSVEVLRPMPRWVVGQNTQARNLMEGLRLVVPTDRIVVLEDDDWIAPWWLERVSEWLRQHDLVGEAPSHYRYVDGRTRVMQNRTHASLCATAMRDGAIDEFRRVMSRHKTMIDVNLWKRGGKLHPWAGGVIGIKGAFPGRPGIGIGHSERCYAGAQR